MVSECTTSAPESTGSGFSARTSTIARRLETTHSGSYVALSSRVAAGVERAGAGVSGRGEWSRREPGWLSVDDRDATRDTGHLRRPGPPVAPGPAGNSILSCDGPVSLPGSRAGPLHPALRSEASVTVDPMRYPEAPRLDLVEDLHGHRVADPYRWLEDDDDPRTTAWTAAQDELAAEHLAGLPMRNWFARRLEQLVHAGAVGVPVWRGDRAFSTRRDPGQEHAVLRVREADGTLRVLVDPMSLDREGTTTLDAWSPSWEGDRLAYQVSVGGDEESLLYVLDVSTGEVLDGPIDRCRYSPVAWLPGGGELFYVRRLAPEQVPAGEEQFHRRVWRHRIGTDPDEDVLVHGEGSDPTTYFGVRTSRDGRWVT